MRNEECDNNHAKNFTSLININPGHQAPFL